MIYELTRESKEKKMDKENHRVNKANCNSIKNQNEARDLVFKGDEIQNKRNNQGERNKMRRRYERR